MAKKHSGERALVVLGYDHPDQYNGVVYMRTVGRGLDALIARLQEGSPHKVMVHAWAPVKDAVLANRFVRSAKRARIHGYWYHVERSDILPAMLFINGDVVFTERHRLSYLKNALMAVPEMEAQ